MTKLKSKRRDLPIVCLFFFLNEFEIFQRTKAAIENTNDPIFIRFALCVFRQKPGGSPSKKILQIPLAKSTFEDFQVWRGELSGSFSVRSAYRLLQESTLLPSNIIQTNTKNFYKKLWSLNMPSEIKITVWRISWNYVPTFSNLKMKKMVSAD
ncbi:hypothetical protein J1N35_002906 [Gossypium stocksii]|uniref:Reverse transcriptase zinc-binding domain-containing protein n=1 Tax=Gossypium stocksii TaxID=47602 RepID=A0A9D3WMZ5_9ROSI|nr:hypothetical protein J1N35_002906 [Gossypium stocksii]